ncbi:hypothetical protein Xen7305DRAFT_00038780 [Xenococcus sp. PCC 7305]|uniref:hypothetical protein n=1 Tax=Xenococcus sp. PCC 7305 TaxID=102125 RepID=UPI0002ACE263|nr:hypothetical protein [Xenococcus sp. PCC 7305]ELS04150.1 hypothetical protein Xen7305DRAFT_00038780 [Xenococcus sp. PCC 7305]
MSNPRKEKIINDLKRARQTGELKAEKIKEIISTAIAEARSEVKEGREEISNLVKDAVSAVAEIFQDKKGEIKEEITASIEGAIEGIASTKREAIDTTKLEINTLQAKVDNEEEQLQQQIDNALEDLQDKPSQELTNSKDTIAEAVSGIKNSEEVALLQKRYAQLKAQLAIVQANLANRYGEKNIDQYLDDAKAWYEKAKNNPEVFTEKIEQQQQSFEQKLGEAGSAIAKKERQIKQLLQELWQSISEIFRD